MNTYFNEQLRLEAIEKAKLRKRIMSNFSIEADKLSKKLKEIT